MRRRLGIIIVFIAFLLIIMATLYPFAFNFKGTGGVLRDFLIIGHGRSDKRDVVRNILLFMPLGLGLGRLLIREMQTKWITSLSVTALVSFGLSYAIEVLQIFIPSRFSSIIDVLSNVTGGILGFLCFLFWEWKVRIAGTSTFVKKNLLPISVGYLAMIFFVTIYFQPDRSLINWDKNYTLLLGNEATGDRPWQGCISEVYIANRAITQEEVTRLHSHEKSIDSLCDSLLVSYQFDSTGNYHDHSSHLPALAWRGTPTSVERGTGVCFGPGYWLETTKPAVFLTEKISATSQLTVGVTVETGRTTQTGPARIISFSADPGHRNFTLGQQGRDLHVRLRTPLTLTNGARPPLVVPNVFSPKNKLNLVVTYNGAVESVYVNGMLSSQSLGLSPDSISLGYSIRWKAFHLVWHKLHYYAIIFLPLGILFALLIRNSRNSLISRVTIITAITILSSLLFEVMLAEVTRRNMRPENIILGILITMSAMLFVNLFNILLQNPEGDRG